MEKEYIIKILELQQIRIKQLCIMNAPKELKVELKLIEKSLEYMKGLK